MMPGIMKAPGWKHSWEPRKFMTGETESDLDCHVIGQFLVKMKWCSVKKLLEAMSISSYVRFNVE